MPFDGRGKTVMVVDNDRTTLEMIQIRLDVAGYHPMGARTGMAALEVLGYTRPDALILDRNLSDVDGLAFLEAIAHLQVARPLPILLVGRALAADEVRQALALGVRDVLAKPFSGAAVLERLGRMLQKTSPSPQRAAADLSA